MCISKWIQAICTVNYVIPTHPHNTKDILHLTYGQVLLPKKSRKKVKTRLKLRTQLSVFINKSFGYRFPFQVEQSTDIFFGMAEPQLCYTSNGQVQQDRTEQVKPSRRQSAADRTGFRPTAASPGKQSCSLPKCAYNLHRHKLRTHYFCLSWNIFYREYSCSYLSTTPAWGCFS